MRIALITPGFSASEADWCVPALLDLVRVLAELDEVTVFSLRYPHSRGAYAVHGATVLPTGGAQRAGWRRLPILWRTLARIRRAHRERPFDLLHALWAHEPGFLAVLAGRLLRLPVVVSILGGELADLPDLDYGGDRGRVNRWLVARALAGADLVTTGSRWLAEEVASRVPPAKLRRQPLGVDFDRFRPYSPSSETLPRKIPRLTGNPSLLQVASLSPVKDQAILLGALARIVDRYPRAHLHLVGEGELDDELEGLAGELGIAERVVLHGAVDHGRLAGYYQQADLYVQSSRFESQGMAVLEAVACGCPVVGTSVGVLPELGERGGTAEAGTAEAAELGTAKPGDAVTLADAMHAVLRDQDLCDQLRAAQAAAVRAYELRAGVARWRGLYRSLSPRTEGGDREATD